MASRENSEIDPRRRQFEDATRERQIGERSHRQFARDSLYQSAKQQYDAAVSAGVMESALPRISPNMAKADLKAATARISQFTSRRQAAPSPPASAVAPATATPAPAGSFLDIGFGTAPLGGPLLSAANRAGNMARTAFEELTLPAPKTAASQGIRTSTGRQVAATDPGGVPKLNADGSQRYVSYVPSTSSSLENAIPGFNSMSWADRRAALKTHRARVGDSGQSTVLDPGVSKMNYRGERNVATPQGVIREVDPSKDQLRNWVSPSAVGAPSGATKAVTIDPRYQVPGASPIGYATEAPAKPTQFTGFETPAASAPVAPKPAVTPPATAAPRPGFGDIKTIDGKLALPPTPADPNAAVVGALSGQTALGGLARKAAEAFNPFTPPKPASIAAPDPIRSATDSISPTGAIKAIGSAAAGAGKAALTATADYMNPFKEPVKKKKKSGETQFAGY